MGGPSCCLATHDTVSRGSILPLNSGRSAEMCIPAPILANEPEQPMHLSTRAPTRR